MRTIVVVAKSPTKAELRVPGVGDFLVNANKRELRPATKLESLGIIGVLHADPKAVDAVLSDVEHVASMLFPDFEDCGLHWVWELHEDCCICDLPLN